MTKQAERMEIRHEINHHDDFRNVFVNYITSAIKEANCSSLINSKDQKTQPSMVEGISTRTQENTRCR